MKLVIEQTAKRWKLLQLLSLSAALLLAPLLFLLADSNSAWLKPCSVAVFAAGIFGWLAGRFAAWWFHG